MKSFKNFSLLFISFLLIFSSCSIQKKQYSSGYHVEWFRNSNRSEKHKTIVAAKAPTQNSNVISQLNSPPKAITKSENKNFHSAIAIQNPLSRANRIERNFFEKLNVLPIDSLKTNSQKINSDQKNDTQKRKQQMEMGVGLLLLGFFILVLTLSGQILLPSVVGIFVLLLGLVFAIISSSHQQKQKPEMSEVEKAKVKEKNARKKRSIRFILGLLVGILLDLLEYLCLWYITILSNALTPPIAIIAGLFILIAGLILAFVLAPPKVTIEPNMSGEEQESAKAENERRRRYLSFFNGVTVGVTAPILFIIILLGLFIVFTSLV